MTPTALKTILVLIVIALASLTITAQESETQNSDILRQKIELLEKVDIKSKSATVQEVYRGSLLRLYAQYAAALALDIADLKKIQTATEGNNPSPKSEVATQIQRLSLEKGVTEEKIKTLNESGVAAAPSNTGTNGTDAKPGGNGVTVSVPRNDAAPAQPSTASKSAFMKASTVPLSEVGTTTPKAPEDATKITLCGQIRPASITQVFTFIGSVSPGVLPKTQVLLAPTGAAHDTNPVQNSRLGVDPGTGQELDIPCVPKRELSDGSQKDAVVKVLQTLLTEVKDNPDAKKALSGYGALSTRTIQRQIELLQGYIGNVKVTIEGGTNPLTPLTDKDGNFTISVEPNKTYTISTEADSGQSRREISVGDKSVRVNLPIEDRPVSLLTRAIVGYEQAGAAAAKSNQNYFFDLFVSKSFPFKQKIDPDFGERLRTWVDFRFGSVPQTGDVTIGDLATGTGFATQVKALKVKDVARVLEFMGGLEYRLTGNAGLLPSFDRLTKQKFSLSLIGGGGFTTPTNPLDSISVFKVTPGAPGLPPSSVGKDFVAFVQSDRDKFFRQYYLGLRMQSFYFNLFNMPMQRFPSQLDIAIGQNEFVTRGKLKGPVVRIDGFFPLPYDGLKFINIIGTAMLRPGHTVTGFPLVLQPAPDGTVVPAANVDLIQLPQPSRDYYRVGFGIDLMSLIQKLNQH